MTARVLMIQPVIPKYRMPLFEALAALPDVELTIQASAKVPHAPDSIAGLPSWIDTTHDCMAFAGDRFFWQKSLSLPTDFGRGDVLVFNGNPRFMSSIPLFARARRRGVGTLWWGHGWSSTSVAWRARIRYALMHLADVTLLYSDDEVAALRAQRQWNKPLLALNNTIETAPMRQAAARWDAPLLAAFRRDRGFEGRRLLLFCGRLRAQPPTELEVALAALRSLLERDPRWMLVVVGSGDEEARLRALAQKLGVAESVSWNGAIYDESSLAPWFMSAEFFVFPGSIGLGLMHAFAYGLPVITHGTRSLHGPEIAALREGENGSLFKRGAPDSLAERIEAVCNTQEVRQRMAASALSTVLTTFGFESMVNRFAEAIRLTSRMSLSGSNP